MVDCYEIKDEGPIILDDIDWSDEEWTTLLKAFGLNEAMRIIVREYVLEVDVKEATE